MNTKKTPQNALAEMLSKELGYSLTTRATGKTMLSIIGLFNKGAKEVVEMLYEFNEPLKINSDAMEKTFGLTATPFEQRISETLDWARTQL